jgi:leader peptidase (prepilin peptidase)/N-methyltransferase
VTAIVGARLAVVGVSVVAGLLVGSFLNVVVYRAPRRISVVAPGSFCPSCQAPIRGYDNIPVVSWVVLRGRCRRCGTPISIRYPAVELVTGLVFGLLAAAVGPRWAVAGLCALVATMVVFVAVELDGMPPLANVAYIGTTLGVTLLTAAAVADRHWWRLGGMLIGVGAAAGLIGLARRMTARPARALRSPWGLLPAGALLGWLGPIGSGVGAVLTLGVLTAERRWSHAFESEDRGDYRRPGVALAAAVGAVAAVLSAWAAGSSF